MNGNGDALLTWTDRIIRWGFYLLFILVPIILTPWNYELFEYNKMMTVYTLTVVIATAWILKCIAQRKIAIPKTPFDIPIALFFISQLVSSIFSIDPHVSWNGYYSRFNGGMWSIISYIVLFYAFVSNFITLDQPATNNELGIRNKELRKKHKNPTPPPSQFIIHHSVFTLLKGAIASAIIVALYGVAERMGIDKHLWVQDVQSRVFSSLGQPNWLAAYLVALIPLSLAFALKPKALQKVGFWMWSSVSVLFFVVLLFTRSRSGLMGLVATDILFWGILYIKVSDRKTILRPFGIFHVICALIIFFNGSNIAQIDRYATLNGVKSLITASTTKQSAPVPEPQSPETQASQGPALESGGTESGVIRKYVWEAAITAWRSTWKTYLIGTGTETFAFAFYQFRPIGHNLTSEWDFLYNKAHNEYLNFLATTGLFGLISYLLFVGMVIVWFVRHHIATFLHRSSQNQPDGTQDTEYISVALFAGWISILITNFFGFSVVVVQLMFYLFPAVLFVLTIRNTHDKAIRIQRLEVPMEYRKPFTVVFIVLGSITIGILVLRWYADTKFALAYRMSRNNQLVYAKTLLDQAIIINPTEPMYHDERSTVLSSLALGTFEQGDATGASQLAAYAVAENDRAIAISPKNVNFYKTRTKIFYALTMMDPNFNAYAIDALLKALVLSPNDPKLMYNLAILYGRDAKPDKSIDLLQKAITAKFDYRDAYYALYIFYSENKQPVQARATIEKYLSTVRADDADFKKILGQ